MPGVTQLCLRALFVGMFCLIALPAAAEAQTPSRWNTPVVLQQLNSAADDYAPALAPNGSLYITSERDGRALMYRLEAAARGDVNRTPTLAEATFNAAAPNNQSYINFAPDGRAYFSAFRLLERRPVLNIFTAEQIGDAWREPAPVEELNSDDFTAHPSLSPSGRTMVFTSNRPGGRGGTDLWISTRRSNGRWEVPLNLGLVLNSPGDEITPHLATDDSLFFASNGFGGRGGFDIFLSIREGGVWQAPIPLKSINSPHDESDCLLLPSGALIFAGNRPGGAGGLDLWLAEPIRRETNEQREVEYLLESNAPAITIRETVLVSAIDILPFVFFDENSDVLPADQRLLNSAETRRFDESGLPNNPQELHGDVLNIIGSRMQRYADAQLQVLGATDEHGRDERGELGRQRAQAVVDYLRDVWNIDADRLIVAGRGLPANPSTTQLAEGRAENRRVELSGDSRILAPVRLQSVRTQVEGTALRLELDARPRQDVTSWALQLRNSYGTVLASWDGVELPAYIEFSAADVSADDFSRELQIDFSGTDRFGRRGAKGVQLPVERVSTTIGGRYQSGGDASLRRYQLPPFAYDQAELSTEQETMVYEIVNSITGDARIVVTGYTDVLGSDGRNQALANQRAIAVARRIGKLAPQIDVRVEAQGSRALFDNATPLGRFLSRTVRVLVRSSE